MGTGVELLQGHCVCWGWAPFQAYSDDSPLCVDLITGFARVGRQGVVLGFLLSPWLVLSVALSIVSSLLDWSGIGKAGLAGLSHGTGTDRDTFGLCVRGFFFESLDSLLIAICGSRTGHGWFPSAVCSSATELFVHRPCTHGTALLLSDVHGWVTFRFKLAYVDAVVCCMAAICLEYPSPIFTLRGFHWVHGLRLESCFLLHTAS
ncbi:hypothetical protein K505DRAFT_63951 [Melanomma pulvis-pyrius CBS 109.77]|uniref:Uncharacterized protein n=1 Tax=Melanomma pulvis-pyrius CBS 109.77 TaxID=1314802 RepID=A0A6A6X5I5_9PLEO|nr:hypothetical protein K505DRAFT_63951 [Melanomma pulvis-pyrius CBS 109.77]